MDNIKIRTCDKCGFQTYNGKVMSNHKRWKHVFLENPEKNKEFKEKISKNSSEKNIRWVKNPVQSICPECSKIFDNIELTHKITGEIKLSKMYCSKTCANKQGSKYVDYEKISAWNKKHGAWKTNFDHDNFGSVAQHSKRELEIVSYLKENFPEDDWKIGLVFGGKKFNGMLLSVDAFSRKLKTIVEYDGIWHFKDIHNQLERKQNIDRALKTACQQKGWRLIRIDEDLKITNDQIKEAVYNSDKSIELFGSKRYGYLD